MFLVYPRHADEPYGGGTLVSAHPTADRAVQRVQTRDEQVWVGVRVEHADLADFGHRA